MIDCKRTRSAAVSVMEMPLRIPNNRTLPNLQDMPGLFERLHEQLGGGSWLIGRMTGSEYAKAASYPDHTDQTYPRKSWFARRDAPAYGIAPDPGARSPGDGPK